MVLQVEREETKVYSQSEMDAAISKTQVDTWAEAVEIVRAQSWATSTTAEVVRDAVIALQFAACNQSCTCNNLTIEQLPEPENLALVLLAEIERLKPARENLHE